MSAPASPVAAARQVPDAIPEPLKGREPAAAPGPSDNPRRMEPPRAENVWRLSANIGELFTKIFSFFDVEMQNGAELNRELGGQKEGLRILKREAMRAWTSISQTASDFATAAAERAKALFAMIIGFVSTGFKIKFQMPPVQLPALEMGISNGGVRVEVVDPAPMAAA